MRSSRTTPSSQGENPISQPRPTNLPLGQRPYPTHAQIQPNRNDADDPNRLSVIRPQVSKDDGKYNAPEVPARAREPANHAVGVRMHVRHEGVVDAVARFEEKRHARDEAEHGGLAFAVEHADGDEEGARDERVAVQEGLLGPDVAAGAAVSEVRGEAAKGPEDDVEQAEHGGPVAGALQAEGVEIGEVVGAEDAIDGELGAEGAEVAAGGDEGLGAGADVQDFAHGRLPDDFAFGRVHHLVGGKASFVVGEAAGGDVARGDDVFFLVAGARRVGLVGAHGGLFVVG